MPEIDRNIVANTSLDWGRVTDEELIDVLAKAPRPGLAGRPKCEQTARRIEAWGRGKKREPLLIAALWLLAGELDRSHAISQTFESSEGAAWHGMMHRREGDFWNAKYWFRRAADLTLYDDLREHLANDVAAAKASHGSSLVVLNTLLGNRNLVESLVDCVEQADAQSTSLLEEVCWREWQILFLHQWDQAR